MDAPRVNSVAMTQWLLETFIDVTWDEPDGYVNSQVDLRMVKWMIKHVPLR